MVKVYEKPSEKLLKCVDYYELIGSDASDQLKSTLKTCFLYSTVIISAAFDTHPIILSRNNVLKDIS